MATTRPLGTPLDEVASAVARTLTDAGVPALWLRAPGLDVGAAGAVSAGQWRHDLDILVSRRDAQRVTRALLPLGWRLHVGGGGLWRGAPTTGYHWDHGPDVFVHRGIPGGPLPSRVFDRLADALWRSSSATLDGVAAPGDEALAVFSAIQAARPTALRPMWLGDLRVHVDRAGIASVATLARRLGVYAAVRWGLDQRLARGQTHRGAPMFDGAVRRGAWACALSLRRYGRPRALAARVGGVPRPGEVRSIVRFADLTLDVGPGVFVPQPVSEALVERALEGLPDGATVVDVGTGVGAVALAIGHTRPSVEVIGCDISAPALRWAQRNRRRLGIDNVRFARGSLLDPVMDDLAGRVSAVTINVPYVPRRQGLGFAEDRGRTVLGIGGDGLGLVRAAVGQAAGVLQRGGRLAVQLTSDQWEILRPTLVGWGFQPEGLEVQSGADAVGWAQDTSPATRPGA